MAALLIFNARFRRLTHSLSRLNRLSCVIQTWHQSSDIESSVRAERQHTDPRLLGLDRHDSALLQCVFELMQRTHDGRACSLWKHILGPQLNDTGRCSTRGCEDGAEIQVVCKYDGVLRGCPRKDLFIRCVSIANVGPVVRSKSFLLEKGNPTRRQVHVDQ